MSGTEAVMQAVRLARYHTGRSHLVRFCGAYHGWWDGVQAGVGNPRPAHEVYTLKEMDADTLQVLETRDDIACVLVNPIQAMHPNGAPPSDSTLVASDRAAALRQASVRRVAPGAPRRLHTSATSRSIIDDVFLGFRLAPGGTQEYFGVRADMVTYGKTLGGGLARRRRLRPRGSDAPLPRRSPRRRLLRARDLQLASVVMATMNEFLRYLDEPEVEAAYDDLERSGTRARRV